MKPEYESETSDWKPVEKTPITPGMSGIKGILLVGAVGLAIGILVFVMIFMVIQAGMKASLDMKKADISIGQQEDMEEKQEASQLTPKTDDEEKESEAFTEILPEEEDRVNESPEEQPEAFQEEEEAEEDLYCVTYEKELGQDGIRIFDRITYKAKDDVIQQIVERLEIDMYGFEGESLDTLIEIYDALMDTYNSLDGVQATGRMKDDVYLVDVIVDTSEADFTELTEAGLFQIFSDGDSISLDESIRLLEEQGYQRVEQ